ncbi:MAG: thioredoxin reductase (NADPH) [Alteromonas naphthalenivorans]|jgi:thioredoxin reductase (NADPH)
MLKKPSQYIIWGLVTLVCFGVAGGWRYLKKPQLSGWTTKGFMLKKLEGLDNVVPFLVIGSGPASLSAALYGSRTKVRTVVLRGNKPGGQLTGTSYIENWPGITRIKGGDVVALQQEQAESFGSIMVDDTVSSVDFSKWPYVVETEEGHTINAMAIMIGTGATARGLNVEGEQTYWGRGVTTCAICDAPYHRDHDVVVVGGGDSAMEEAIELSPYAKNITILVRGDILKASPSMVDRVLGCHNIVIEHNRAITEVKGDGYHVTNIDVKNTKTGEIENWPITGVFLGIGHDPNTKLFKESLKTNKNNYLVIDGRTQQTSYSGVVAAGDVCDPRYRQAGVAAGDGIKAGLDVVWWLSSLGYNQTAQNKLEPFFFEKPIKKIEVAHINSDVEIRRRMKDSPEKLVFLDFYTDACPTCMHMMPVIDWAAAKFVNKVRFFKVDAADAFDMTKKYKVPDVPHFLVMRGDKVVGRFHDIMDRPELYKFIKKFLVSDTYTEED